MANRAPTLEGKQLPDQFIKAAGELMFRHVHGGQLIYNSCWEDPRIDRELMKLDKDSEVVMITSAGCNALDYLLDDAARIHTVDVNFRQNAVLELKKAMFRRGDFFDLFEMFGIGTHTRFRDIFDDIRRDLPSYAVPYWKRNARFFDAKGVKKSFYYQGAAGAAAWIVGVSLFRSKPNIKNFAMSLFDAETVEQQKEIYEFLEPRVWRKLSNWLIRQKIVMTMLGVPGPQIQLIKDEYPGGLEAFVKDKIKHVFTELPARDNYFWRVYVTGSYTMNCCPEYLRKDNFEVLQDREDRISPYTGTITNFLKENPGKYSHFVLLDHQDWLAYNDIDALMEEWEQIFANARPGAKVLLRSAAMDIDFIPDEVKKRLKFFPELTEPLHVTDRVGTYGSTHFAEIV